MSAPTQTLDALRREIRRIEHRTPVGVVPNSDAVVTLGCPSVDNAVGGLAPGAHHLTSEARASAAGLGFAVALAVSSTGPRRPNARLAQATQGAWSRLLVVESTIEAGEHGGVYAPGLRALGLDPDRVAYALTKSDAESLRVAHEAVRAGVADVIVRLYRSTELDMTAGRQLTLAAMESGTFLYVCSPPVGGSTGMSTRWLIETAASGRARRSGRTRLLGPPNFRVTLEKNVNGRPGGPWTLEWRGGTFWPAAAPARTSPGKAVTDSAAA